MNRALAALALTVAATSLAHPPPAATSPSAATAPATGTHAVILKDGTRIACTEPPLVAMGRVLYRTADGARHALPADKVDLEKTRPAQRPAVTPVSMPQRAQATPAGAAGGKPGPGTAAGARREAPDFSAKRADGTAVKLSELRGKVVLLDFWATWCGPCVVEMPNVKRAYAKHAGPQFEIVGVSLDRSKAELDAFVKAQGMTWPQSFDGKGWENAVARQYGVSSIPTTILLDREGRIARVGIRGPQLEEAIAEILAEKPPKAG